MKNYWDVIWHICLLVVVVELIMGFPFSLLLIENCAGILSESHLLTLRD